MASITFVISLLLAIFLLCIGCTKKLDAISVETLVRDASQHNFKIVTVTGCFRAGLETHEIVPCAPNAPYQDWIWADDIRSVEAFEAIPAIKEGDKYPRHTQKERLTDAEQAKYNEMFHLPSFVLTPVVIRGEFQASTEKSFGYGPFNYRIVVYKVLAIGPTPKPN